MKTYMILMLAASTCSLSAQVDWANWTSLSPGGGATADAASGTMLINGISSSVSVEGCLTGNFTNTIVNGTGTEWTNPSHFIAGTANGDVISTDNIESAHGNFVLSFSSAITNPVFYISERHHLTRAYDNVTNAQIDFEVMGGELALWSGSTNILGADTWTGGAFITASNTNGVGTTANGTFRMLGTFSEIRLQTSSEDYFNIQVGDDNYVVPEPSSALLLGFSALSLLVRRKR